MVVHCETLKKSDHSSVGMVWYSDTRDPFGDLSAVGRDPAKEWLREVAERDLWTGTFKHGSNGHVASARRSAKDDRAASQSPVLEAVLNGNRELAAPAPNEPRRSVLPTESVYVSWFDERAARRRDRTRGALDSLTFGLYSAFREAVEDDGDEYFMGMPQRPGLVKRSVRGVKSLTRGIGALVAYVSQVGRKSGEPFEAEQVPYQVAFRRIEPGTEVLEARVPSSGLEQAIDRTDHIGAALISDEDFEASIDRAEGIAHSYQERARAVADGYVTSTLDGRTLYGGAKTAVEGKQKRLETFAEIYAGLGGTERGADEATLARARAKAAAAVGITSERTIADYVARVGNGGAAP